MPESLKHRQRKQIILSAAEAITTYGNAAAPVLDPDRAQLVNKVTAEAVAAIKRTGCICPDLDVSVMGEAPGTRFLKGRDGRCGMHEEVPA